MNSEVHSFIVRFMGIGVLGYIIICIINLLSSKDLLYSLSLAYFLSFIFVGSNLAVINKFSRGDNKRFYKIFFISIVLRFLLVIASLVFILKVIKIHQIYFTVSFIISYIFHSVIEIIFINKILETEIKK